MLEDAGRGDGWEEDVGGGEERRGELCAMVRGCSLLRRESTKHQIFNSFHYCLVSFKNALSSRLQMSHINGT